MPRKFKVLPNIFLLILFAALLTGCVNEVSGVVVDADGNPMAGVTVVIDGSRRVTVETDEDGNWSAPVSGKEVAITAVKDGYEFDTVVLQTEELEPVTITAKPGLTVKPAAGYYEDVVLAALTIAGDYTIYYTVDGSEPTEKSAVYSEPIIIEETTLLKAIAVNNADKTDVKELSAKYDVDLKNILKNGGFELGLDGWEGKGCDISLSEDAYSGSYSVLATNRNDTGCGPQQRLYDSIQPGKTYQVSARVKYVGDSAPDTRFFFITFQDGDSWVTAHNGPGADITKDEWGLIEGTYTPPVEIDRGDTGVFPLTFEDMRVFIETSWTAEQDPNRDLMDFYVDDVTIILLED